MTNTPPRLFEPITLGTLTLAHRIWVAPMCQNSSADGMPTDWHLAHLGSFAIGRAGLVMAEATAVSADGRITPADTGIWTDAQADAWARIVDFVHTQEVPIGIQLAHAGRKASTRGPSQGRGALLPEEGGWLTRGPSSAAYGRLPEPSPLTANEVTSVIDDFVAAARRSIRAGFDLIEIHGAHGYLIDEFLSPLSNFRDDIYGGDAERRTRLLLDIVDAVRAVMPAGMPMVVRLSATDWVPGGLSAADTALISCDLEAHGVDLVSVSSAGNDHRQDIPVGPGYQVPLAREVRRAVDIPVGVAGLITSPQQAESIVVDGAADVIYFARQFLREPTFALRAAAELGGSLEWALPYRMAKFSGSIP